MDEFLLRIFRNIMLCVVTTLSGGDRLCLCRYMPIIYEAEITRGYFTRYSPASSLAS